MKKCRKYRVNKVWHRCGWTDRWTDAEYIWVTGNHSKSGMSPLAPRAEGDIINQIVQSTKKIIRRKIIDEHVSPNLDGQSPKWSSVHHSPQYYRPFHQSPSGFKHQSPEGSFMITNHHPFSRPITNLKFMPITDQQNGIKPILLTYLQHWALRAVERCKHRAWCHLVGVSGTSVVYVMTQACHKQGKTLDLTGKQLCANHLNILAALILTYILTKYSIQQNYINTDGRYVLFSSL